MYTLKISDEFKEDVKSSVNYIKYVLQNPIAAKRLKDEVKIKYYKIYKNPYIYPAVPDDILASKGYRFTMVKNYMIFFKIIEKNIEIIRFIYGPRDWANILKGMK
jgi:plasmid stabilization system protein ParE